MARLMALVCATVVALGGALGSVAFADKVGDRIAALSSMLASNREDDVRLKATLALLKERDKRAVAPLLAALADTSPDVRGLAAYGLGKLVDKSVDLATRRQILGTLDAMRQNDPDNDARREAADAYKKLKAQRWNVGLSTQPIALNAGSPLLARPAVTRPQMFSMTKPVEEAAPALERSVVTNEQIAAAPDTLRALRMALEECDAQTLGWWIKFPLSFKGATYADKAALRDECKRGAAPVLGADALEAAMGGMQVDLDGGLAVTVDHTAWRFVWRDHQWWLVAIE